MNSFKSFPYLVLLVCLFACQQPTPPTPEYVAIKEGSTVAAKKGERKVTTLTFQIRDGLHIMSNEGEEDAFLYTDLTMDPNDQLQFGTPEFPKARSYKIPGSSFELPIFEDELVVNIPIRVNKSASAGKFIATGQLFYQACNHNKCFPPVEMEFEMVIQVE